jgi:SAM-dependent methyltransferase
MRNIFGNEYASAYDVLYSDKDYAAECDLIEQVIRDYGLKPTHSILDLGCGTGNHALPLAQRGYEITGVDRSEEMLALARTKAREHGSSTATFHSGDIRTADLGRKFDAALMMFAVLGYQLENKDAIAALATARRHLKSGCILIFDVWYGPAVLRMRPSERSKETTTPEGKLVRIASGTLDIARQICTVNYQVTRIDRGRTVGRIEETHVMRYFFPFELDLLLDSTGFSRLRTGAFPEFTCEPDESTWNVLIAARAI